MDTYIGGTSVRLPSSGALVSLSLSSPLQQLRDEVLHRQGSGASTSIPTLPLIDAQTWSRYGQSDWLIWRAHRTAERLRQMPIEIREGEQIVGCPELRPPNEAETEQIAQAQAILREIPSFPGGDAGHFHPDYERLFRYGIQGVRKQIQACHANADPDRRIFYEACDVAMAGLSEYILRVADACEARSESSESDHWQEIANACRHVSLEPPQSCHAALQLMFLSIIARWFGEDPHLTSPALMCQRLRPCYESYLDVENGHHASF